MAPPVPCTNFTFKGTVLAIIVRCCGRAYSSNCSKHKISPVFKLAVVVSVKSSKQYKDTAFIVGEQAFLF